jgi:serine/threonine protein kinase
MAVDKQRENMTSSSNSSSSNNSSRSNSGQNITVAVIDKEIKEDKGKKRTVYQIEVANAGTSSRHSRVYRRYNECLTMLEKVKKLKPEVSSDSRCRLPGKKLFRKADDSKVVKERRRALKDFVVMLMTHRCNCTKLPDVRTFLGLDFPHCESTLDDDDEAYDSQSDRHGSTSSGESNRVPLGPSEKSASKPDDFEFLKVIGKGSFGKVLLARQKSEDVLYAVKVLNKSQIIRRNEVKHIMAERNVLIRNIRHPFLVGLHYSFQTTDKLYFVLDYINGGELFFHIQREKLFSEERSRFYAAEIASALGYLHSLDIVYRDLKPENILLDEEGHVALTDFGLCKEGIAAKTTTNTFCGTPEYLAPEIIQKKPYDRTVDWWCLGAVLYEMIFGLPPFYSRDTSVMYDNTLNKSLQFRKTATASSPAKDIIEKMLQKNKELRLGAKDDFEEIKNHEFFKSIDWTLLNRRAIRPPFVPDLSGKMDLQNFDQEFIHEPVPASVEKARRASLAPRFGKSAADVFSGFSYVKPGEECIQL